LEILAISAIALDKIIESEPMTEPTDPPNEPNQELDSDGVPLNGSDYNSEDLKHLSDLEHVRKRPGMYIGDTTLKGLHHLAYELSTTRSTRRWPNSQKSYP